MIQTKVINGELYYKVEMNEPIKKRAFHSYGDFGPVPILHPETVGQTPSNFSPKRTFWNPCGDMTVEEFCFPYDPAELQEQAEYEEWERENMLGEVIWDD